MKLANKTMLLFCLSFLLSTAIANEQNSTEYKIKAGYLYNFIKFVTWPKDESVTFNICILGQDPFGREINPIEARTAFGLPIKLIRFHTPTNRYRCHILFISKDAAANFISASVGAEGTQNINRTLLVSESSTLVTHTGMIGFMKREGKIKLLINLPAVQKSQLSISAKLLEVAEIIGGAYHE